MMTIKQALSNDLNLLGVRLKLSLTQEEQDNISTILKNRYGKFELFYDDSGVTIGQDEINDLVDMSYIVKLYELEETKKAMYTDYNLLDRINLTSESTGNDTEEIARSYTDNSDIDSTNTNNLTNSVDNTNTNNASDTRSVSGFDSASLKDSEKNTVSQTNVDTSVSTNTGTVKNISASINDGTSNDNKTVTTNHTNTQKGYNGQDIEQIIQNRLNLVKISWYNQIAQMIVESITTNII